MTLPKPLMALFAALLVLAFGAGGYFYGASEAPGDTDAHRAQRAAELTAERHAFDVVFDGSYRDGRTRGLAKGATLGKAKGSAGGHRAGSSSVEKRLAAIEAQEQAEAAAAAEAAAEADAAERSANCDAPLFVEDYCPTDEEIARESAAESLCGPGTALGQAQAAELGIQC
jgi:hypothetical protein